jgi:AcrR family transcriptional regulator
MNQKKPDDIIAAAAKVFSVKGYHAATVQDIAGAVGLLKGSLYHHFRSKEELLYLVIREPIARLYATVEEIVQSDLPAGDKLRRAAAAHVQALHDHFPHLFVYLRESDDVQRRFRTATRLSPKLYEVLWQQILREGVKSGEFRSDVDVKVVSYGLLGMLNWLYKWYRPDGRLSPDQIAKQFAALSLGGLASPGRRRRRLATSRRRRD